MRLKTLLRILEKVREEVLKELRHGMGREIVGRGVGGDITYRVDEVAEETIIRELKELGVRATLISEECGVLEINGGGELIVLDPLDGSTNAIRGIPVFSCSVAVSKGDRFNDVYLAAVMNFVTGDIFYALRGEGAYLNGRHIRPSSETKLERAVIEVDLNIKGRYLDYLERIRRIIVNAGHIRFLGSDALALCLVACGASDAFIDLRGILRVTDMVAGAFIAKEAGALVRRGDGREFNPHLTPNSRSSIIAAGTQELFDKLLSLITRP